MDTHRLGAYARVAILAGRVAPSARSNRPPQKLNCHEEHVGRVMEHVAPPEREQELARDRILHRLRMEPHPLADFTYEGARSVTGPFLAQLGAAAAVISIVSGLANSLAMRCG